MSEHSSGRVFSIVKPLKEILKDFEVREMEGKKESLGFAFPDFPVWNESLSGLRRGHLHLMVMPSKYARRHILLEIAVSAIKAQKVPVLFMSFDKSPKDILCELVAKETTLPLSTVQTLKVKSNAERKEKLKTGLENLAKYQGYLHILGGSQLDTPEQIEAHLDWMKGAYKTRDVILIIDSLQRIPSYSSYPSQEERINDLCNRLKTIAVSREIPVLASSDVSAEGQEIDDADNKDKVVLNHAWGSGSLDRYCDTGMSASKNWMDSAELDQQLKSIAESINKSVVRLPDLDVIDVYFDKSPGDLKKREGIQLLLYHVTGHMSELGIITDSQVVRANRMAKALNSMVDEGYLEFYDPADDDQPEVAADAAAPGAVPGMGDAAAPAGPPKKKIKPSIKLSR